MVGATLLFPFQNKNKTKNKKCGDRIARGIASSNKRGKLRIDMIDALSPWRPSSVDVCESERERERARESERESVCVCLYMRQRNV